MKESQTIKGNSMKGSPESIGRNPVQMTKEDYGDMAVLIYTSSDIG